MSAVTELRERALCVLSGFSARIPYAVREELAQETVLRVCERDGLRDPRAFVRSVASHLAIDHLRRERGQRVPLAEDDHADDWQSRTEASLELAGVLRALGCAPRAYRELLTALVVEDRSMVEIVERTLGPERGPKARRRARETAYRRRSRAFAWVRAHVER